MSDLEEVNEEEIKESIERNGVSGIEEFFKMQLGRWKKMKVNIGITGNAGVGKSSFINVIRGLNEDDDGAAPVDSVECTKDPTSYDHPTYPKVKFWDLPGIGTPNYPDLETYLDKAHLDKYHTFLILVNSRFTENDIVLAKEIKRQGKSFFFIRTKIDEDVQSEKRKKSFSEAAVLQKIRRNCTKNLVDEAGKPISSKDDIFLISNHHPGKWDFSRLTAAILDALPRYQREALVLSLSALTSFSKNILKRKVAVLKERMIPVTGASVPPAMILIPVLSLSLDAALVSNVVRVYKAQLGIPEEGSERFGRLSPVTQKKFLDLNIKLANSIQLASEATAKGLARFARYIPLVGPVIVGTSTYTLLCDSLKEIEEVSLAVLEENCLMLLRS